MLTPKGQENLKEEQEKEQEKETAPRHAGMKIEICRQDKHGEARRTMVAPWVIAAVVVGIILLFILMNGIYRGQLGQLNAQLKEQQRIADTLRINVTTANEKIEELTLRDEEQDRENATLSSTLTAKSDELAAMQAAEAARYIPNAYPLRGAATLLAEEPQEEGDPEEEETDPAEENPAEENPIEENPIEDSPIEDSPASTGTDAMGPEEKKTLDIPEDAPAAVFSAAAESRAIATADGTVVSVTGNADKGYQIVLDHGNGYTSVYEGFGLALAGENDTVGRGSVLLYFVDETSIFTYWVRYADTWIDPLENMEING